MRKLFLTTALLLIAINSAGMEPVPEFFEPENVLNMSLCIAIDRGENAKIAEYLQDGADPTKIVVFDDGSRTLNALRAAISKENIPLIKQFLTHKNITAEVLNAPQTNIMRCAVNNGSEEIAKLLLDTNLIDVHYAPKGQCTLLVLALRLKEFNITKLLLERIPDINALSYSATLIEDIALARLKEARVRKEYKETAADFLQLLLSKGFSIDLQNEKGDTGISSVIDLHGYTCVRNNLLALDEIPGLHLAEATSLMTEFAKIVQGHRSFISALLRANARISIANKEGRTPFIFAAKTGSGTIVEEFICNSNAYILANLNLPKMLTELKEKHSDSSGNERQEKPYMRKDRYKKIMDLWAKNKNKHPVWLMRHYLNVKRIMSGRYQNILAHISIPSDIAHSIAQYAITGLGKDFRVTKEDLEK